MKTQMRLVALVAFTTALFFGTTAWTVARQPGGAGGATAALQQAANALLSTINGNVDGLEAAIGAVADAAATAGGTGSLSAKLRQISADIASVKTAVEGTLTANVLVGNLPPMREFATTTLQGPGASANGDGGTLDVRGYGTLFATVVCASCDNVTKINFEGTEDNSNYVPFQMQRVVNARASRTIGATTTEPNTTYWRGPIGAFQKVRARISDYSAGQITVSVHTIFATMPLQTDLADPCSYLPKREWTFNHATAGTYEIANAVTGEYWHICSINVSVTGTQTLALVVDDTDGIASPGTGGAGINGGTTAGTGWTLTTGISQGSGSASIMQYSGASGRYLGFIIGNNVQTSGQMLFVSAP